MMSAVQIDKLNNFIYRGTPVGCLSKSPIRKTLKTAFFVTIDVAAKSTITYTKYQGSLFLCQPVFLPTVIDFLESHQPGLL
jgi:hypothetical protein